MSTWYRKLKIQGACKDAVTWAKTQPSLAAAWRNCERGDWMLWFLVKSEASQKKIMLAACDCASLALKYTKDPRVKAYIVTVRAWARGKATRDQVERARYAAYAAADAAINNAEYAAYDAADAALSADATIADHAANAAACVGDAAVDVAINNAEYAARVKALQQCASIIRRAFPSPPR